MNIRIKNPLVLGIGTIYWIESGGVAGKNVNSAEEVDATVGEEVTSRLFAYHARNPSGGWIFEVRSQYRYNSEAPEEEVRVFRQLQAHLREVEARAN